MKRAGSSWIRLNGVYVAALWAMPRAAAAGVIGPVEASVEHGLGR